MPPRSRNYTAEQLKFLQEQFQTLTVADLTVAFNKRFRCAKSFNTIKACLNNHKIRCGNNMAKGYRKQIMNKEQFLWVRVNYPDMPVRVLTEAFNVEFDKQLTVDQLKTFVHNHGINSGRTGCFVKGQARPPGSGMKPGETNSTSFRKGSVPPNLKPLWDERFSSGELLMKVPQRNPYTGAPTRYLSKKVWVWTHENGPVPQGHVLLSVDGDNCNCDIENIECITLPLHFRLNMHHYKDAPAELKPSIMAMARLEVEMFTRAKETTQIV